MVMPGGLRIHGPAQMRPLLEAYQQAFPDIRSEIMTTVETPDAIALELRISGTHTGPMQTPGGSIPPTGKSVVWESVDIVRVSDGKITSWHAYFDQVAFLTQLGLMPATT
jgi:predicted ester cyclase